MDRLNYQGHIGVPLPFLSIARDLATNGTRRVAAFEPISLIANKYPALHIDCGNDPASSAYDPSLMVDMMSRGWTHDLICKVAMVQTAFEEAYHFVDFTKGRLPGTLDGQGLTPGYTKDSYYDQPHEREATNFAQMGLEYCFQSLIDGSPILYK